MSTTIRAGIGFDIHRFARGRRLVLGGVTIRHKLGLDGHSDADVLCHAITDALLGAVADGDIGTHFRNTDPRWKNANSLGLLKKIAGRLKAMGAHVVNVDSTVIAEAPKLAPYNLKMRRNIAKAIGIPAGRVSVKATTAEKIGTVGRGEGMAAMAVALVEKKRD